MKKNEEKEKKKKLNKLSEWILDYDKNAYCDPKISNEDREILIESFNECSDLRKSFHDSLQNLFDNLGFSASMRNIHKMKSSFNSSENIFGQQRKTFGYPGDFGLIKNNSISKFGMKKGKKINLNQNQIKDHAKPITSIRKRMLPIDKFYEDNEEEEDDEIKKMKKEKSERDKTELEIINKMVYGDIIKEGKYGHEKVDILSEEVKESENEDIEAKKSIEIKKNLEKNQKYEKNKDKILNNIFNEFGKSKYKQAKEDINDEKEEEEERNEKYNLNKKNYKTQRKLNQENEKFKSTKESNIDRNNKYGDIYYKKNDKEKKK